MGAETADGYRVVNQEERPRVEGSDGLALVPVPRKDLEASTFEGDAIYYAKPSTELVQESWAILNKVVQGKVALITKGALRAGTNTEKIWRLTSFNGYLVLREIRFPENIKPKPDMPKAKPDKATMDLVTQFIDKLSVEWDEFDATDTMAARMSEWMNDGTDVESQTQEAAPLDMKAALAAALEE
jgi:non-homologous end joining protein Ku